MPQTSNHSTTKQEFRPVRSDGQAILILALLFVGTVATSSLVPMMGLYIVEGLNEPPWKIGIYSGIVTVVTLFVNRKFGELIDGGSDISRLVLVSVLAFLAATVTLSSKQSFTTLLIVGALFLTLSNAALSTMYTLGRLYAERMKIDVSLYNSWLRMQTSAGWMVGPALSFFIIGQWGFQATFLVSVALGCIWLLGWFVAVPKNFKSENKSKKTEEVLEGSDWLLVLAASSCVFFALSNMLYTSAMPLFFTQEVGLPSYAPGLSLTVKCFVELIAIFAGAKLAQRWGSRQILYAAAILAVFVFVAIAQVKTVPAMILTAALEGLYYGVFAGVAVTFVQGFANGKMGRATSMYMNSLFLGGTIGSISMGFVATLYDYQTVVYLASVSAGLALLILFISRNADQTQSV